MKKLILVIGVIILSIALFPSREAASDDIENPPLSRQDNHVGRYVIYHDNERNTFLLDSFNGRTWVACDGERYLSWCNMVSSGSPSKIPVNPYRK